MSHRPDPCLLPFGSQGTGEPELGLAKQMHKEETRLWNSLNQRYTGTETVGTSSCWGWPHLVLSGTRSRGDHQHMAPMLTSVAPSVDSPRGLVCAVIGLLSLVLPVFSPSHLPALTYIEGLSRAPEARVFQGPRLRINKSASQASRGSPIWQTLLSLPQHVSHSYKRHSPSEVRKGTGHRWIWHLA